MNYHNEIYQGLRGFYPLMDDTILLRFAKEIYSLLDDIVNSCSVGDDLDSNTTSEEALVIRLFYNNYQDLRDLSTMWYPYINSEDRKKLQSWEDILLYSNLKYNQGHIEIPHFDESDIINQTKEIRKTLEVFGDWFLPNWIDIYPDVNDVKRSRLIFNRETNSARRDNDPEDARNVKQKVYDLWIRHDIKKRYSQAQLFPSYAKHDATKIKPHNFFVNNFPKLENDFDPFYQLFAMEWISQLKIFHSFRSNQVILVTAATGVGKSTIVPMILWKALMKDTLKPFVICTQPRIIPTTNNANRIANQLGLDTIPEDDQALLPNRQPPEQQPFAQYKTGSTSSHITDKNTYLRFETDGILLNSLIDQAIFNHMIIIDECHEHKTNMDLSTTYLKYNAAFKNNKVKVVFVSATMDNDAKRYRSYFAETINRAPVDTRIHLEKPGTTKTIHKIDTIAKPVMGGSLKTPKDIYIAAQKQAIELANIHRGKKDQNILIFYPGQKEILDACKAITKETPSDVICLPLYSALSVEARDAAIKGSPSSITRSREDYEYKSTDYVAENTYSIKVIISTDIAEASVTVKGLSYVIDTGITKKPIYNYEQGFTIIENKWISEESHMQRRGRVGRERPGVFYYLYNINQLENKPNYEICTSVGFTSNIFDMLFTSALKNRITSKQLLDADGDYYFIHPNEYDYQRIVPIVGTIITNIGNFKTPKESQYVKYTLKHLHTTLGYPAGKFLPADLVMKVKDSLRELGDVYPSIWQYIALTYASAYNCLPKMCKFIATELKTEQIDYREQMQYLHLNCGSDYVKYFQDILYKKLLKINISSGCTYTFEDCLASAMPQQLMSYQCGKFSPIFNETDTIFIPEKPRDAYRKCWFHSAVKNGDNIVISDCIPFNKIYQLDSKSAEDIYLGDELNLDVIIDMEDIIAAYNDYKYNVLIPRLEREKNETFPSSQRNGKFKEWIEDVSIQKLPTVIQFNRLLKQICRRLQAEPLQEKWIKKAFQAMMDTLNIELKKPEYGADFGFTYITNLFKNQWKDLVTQGYKFSHKTLTGEEKYTVIKLLLDSDNTRVITALIDTEPELIMSLGDISKYLQQRIIFDGELSHGELSHGALSHGDALLDILKNTLPKSLKDSENINLIKIYDVVKQKQIHFTSMYNYFKENYLKTIEIDMNRINTESDDSQDDYPAIRFEFGSIKPELQVSKLLDLLEQKNKFSGRIIPHIEAIISRKNRSRQKLTNDEILDIVNITCIGSIEYDNLINTFNTFNDLKNSAVFKDALVLNEEFMKISRTPPLQEDALQRIITTPEFKKCKIYKKFTIYKKLKKIKQYEIILTGKDQHGGSTSIEHYWVNKSIIGHGILKSTLDNIHMTSFKSSGIKYALTTIDDVIILFFEKDLVGMAFIYTTTHYLHDLCVHPNFRKKGLADIILQEAKKKYSNLWLKVEAKQEALLCPYYEKRGFKRFQVDANYISLTSVTKSAVY